VVLIRADRNTDKRNLKTHKNIGPCTCGSVCSFFD